MGRVKYLLDSNIYIHFMKNDNKIVNKLREVGFINCYLSEITILELLYGVANSNATRKEENKLKLKQFEGSLVQEYYPSVLYLKLFQFKKHNFVNLALLLVILIC